MPCALLPGDHEPDGARRATPSRPDGLVEQPARGAVEPGNRRPDRGEPEAERHGGPALGEGAEAADPPAKRATAASSRPAIGVGARSARPTGAPPTAVAQERPPVGVLAGDRHDPGDAEEEGEGAGHTRGGRATSITRSAAASDNSSSTTAGASRNDSTGSRLPGN